MVPPASAHLRVSARHSRQSTPPFWPCHSRRTASPGLNHNVADDRSLPALRPPKAGRTSFQTCTPCPFYAATTSSVIFPLLPPHLPPGFFNPLLQMVVRRPVSRAVGAAYMDIPVVDPGFSVHRHYLPVGTPRLLMPALSAGFPDKYLSDVAEPALCVRGTPFKARHDGRTQSPHRPSCTRISRFSSPDLVAQHRFHPPAGGCPQPQSVVCLGCCLGQLAPPDTSSKSMSVMDLLGQIYGSRRILHIFF